MPVRRIPKSHRHVTGLVTHAGTSLPFEGPLERDYYILLTADPTIDSIHPQSVQVKYVAGDGRRTVCYPDVLIRFKHGRRPRLTDVKSREEIRNGWTDLKPRFKAARAFATRQGWEYRIQTEVEIRTPYLENIKFLRGYRDIQVDQVQCQRLLRHVRNGDRWTVKSLMERAALEVNASPLEVLPLIWHMVATWRLQIDWQRPVQMQTALAAPLEGSP